jgi:hypothetical protein
MKLMLDIGQALGCTEYCNEKHNREIQPEKIAYSSNYRENFSIKKYENLATHIKR